MFLLIFVPLGALTHAHVQEPVAYFVALSYD